MTKTSIQSAIQSELTYIIRDKCKCDFPENFISEPVLLCEQQEPTSFVYRASIKRYEILSPDQLINYIENWVEQGASVSINDVVVIFSSDCPVRISDIGDPVCSTTVTPTSSSMGTVDLIVQILSGIVTMAALIAVTILIAVCIHKRRRKRWDTCITL